MGRVKTKEIKRMSFSLMERNPSLFTREFAQNKKAIAEMKIFDEKKAINKIAGYITKTTKRKQGPKQPVVEEQEAEKETRKQATKETEEAKTEEASE